MNNNNIHDNDDNDIHECDKNNIPWAIIESYFRNAHLKQLIRHQIESYNYFINNQIKDTLEMFNPFNIVSNNYFVKKYNKHSLSIEINLKNFYLYRPEIHENNGATKVHQQRHVGELILQQ